MEQQCTKEIIELHQFFVAWFNGKIPNNEATFARFEQVMGLGFGMIGPNGRLTERTPLIETLRQSYGRWQDKPDSSIWIGNIVLRWETADFALLTYEEWQTYDSQTTSHLSSALFQRTSNRPNGVEWCHLQETWIA